MQNKLMEVKTFDKMEKGGDAKNLLNEISRISLQIKINISVYDALDKANVMYYSYMQGEEESNTKYLRKFKSIIEAVEHFGGTIFADNALINYEKMENDNKGKQRKHNKEYKK